MAVSLGQFAAHLLAAEADLHLAMEGATVKGCKMIAKKAKAVIGVEQPEWQALAPSTIEEKARLGYRVPAPLLRTGDMRDSISWSAPYWESPRVCIGYIGSNDPVAKWQELGTSTIPPRPFLGLATAGQAAAIADMAGRMAHRAMIGGPNFLAWKTAFELVHKAWEQAKDLGDFDEGESNGH